MYNNGLFNSLNLGGGIITIVFVILLLLAIRELLCWYRKINQGIKLLKENNKYLEQNLEALNKIIAKSYNNTTEENEDKEGLEKNISSL